MLLLLVLVQPKSLINQPQDSAYVLNPTQISRYRKFTVVAKCHFLHSQIDIGDVDESKEYTVRAELYVEKRCIQKQQVLRNKSGWCKISGGTSISVNTQDLRDKSLQLCPMCSQKAQFINFHVFQIFIIKNEISSPSTFLKQYIDLYKIGPEDTAQELRILIFGQFQKTVFRFFSCHFEIPFYFKIFHYLA